MAQRKQASGYGDGSVFANPDGSHTAQIYIKGKAVRRRRATAEAAQTALDELRELKRGNVDIPKGNQSVQAFSAFWYNEDVLQREIKPRTQQHYLDTLERYVLTAIGTRRVLDVTHTELQTLLNDLRRRNRPLAAQTVQHVRSVLKQFFTCAKRNGLIKDNPALDLVAPTVKQKKKDALSIVQVRHFLASIEHYRLATAYHVMATLGTRLGETLAIRRIDVDFKQALLTIKEQSSYYTSEAAPPKSEAGERVIPIPPLLLERLRHQWNSVKPEADWGTHGLMFPSDVGTRKAPRNFEREWSGQNKKKKGKDGKPVKFHIKGLRERGGLPDDTVLHDFRKFCATQLGGQAIHPMTLKHILGHEAGDVTERYIKRQLPVMRAALEQLEADLWSETEEEKRAVQS